MKYLKYAFALGLAISIFASCVDNKVLLTINKDQYTVDDFNSRIQFAPTDDSVKRTEKINEFVNQMLVICAAREQGYEKDPVVTAAFETNRKDIITRGFYEAQVIDKIKISDYDAKKKYDQYMDQYHLAQIVLPSESLASFLGKEIKRGVEFDSLLKYSLDTLTANGDIGSFSALSLPPEIFEAIKKTKIGTTTEPILFGEYYYILKVIEHKKADTPKFDDVKESIKSSLLREKAMALGEKFTTSLIDKAHVEYNDEGFACLLKPDSTITEKDLDTWIVKKVTGKDTNIVRVRSIIDAVRYQYQRSNLDPKILVQRALLPDLLYDEAIRTKAENLPRIKKDLRNAMNTLLYQKFYSDNVLEKVVIDSAMVVKHFKEHPADYKDKKLQDVYTQISSKIRESMVASLRETLYAGLRAKYNPQLNEKVVGELMSKKEGK
jgi:peptidyl-prolyl cis-trans isomerase C